MPTATRRPDASAAALSSTSLRVKAYKAGGEKHPTGRPVGRADHVYLPGDVLRTYEKGQDAAVIDGARMSPLTFILASLMMLAPILMAIASVFLAKAPLQWLTVACCAALFLLNAFGLKTYGAPYDRMLILVSLVLTFSPLTPRCGSRVSRARPERLKKRFPHSAGTALPYKRMNYEPEG